jgi:hypothetical protein
MSELPSAVIPVGHHKPTSLDELMWRLIKVLVTQVLALEPYQNNPSAIPAKAAPEKKAMLGL